MTTFIEDVKCFNVKSKNFKLLASLLIPFVLFFVLTPGVFVEIKPTGVSQEKKIGYIPALIHSLIFAVIMAFIYYIYLGKVIEHGCI